MTVFLTIIYCLPLTYFPFPKKAQLLMWNKWNLFISFWDVKLIWNKFPLPQGKGNTKTPFQSEAHPSWAVERWHSASVSVSLISPCSSSYYLSVATAAYCYCQCKDETSLIRGQGKLLLSTFNMLLHGTWYTSLS